MTARAWSREKAARSAEDGAMGNVQRNTVLAPCSVAEPFDGGNVSIFTYSTGATTVVPGFVR